MKHCRSCLIYYFSKMVILNLLCCFFFHGRSSELQRAGSGLLDKVITDTRSLKQIPLTEFSSDKDSGTCFVEISGFPVTARKINL